MAKKNIYSLKTVDGNPVRVEEAWKDANGELLTEKVNKADAQTITGLKTFSTLPQSSATPSNDSDLATKKYSDDLWATRKAQEEKCYQALKTVTKGFTSTDPVYVRIGEDGEPEIHYTVATEQSGSNFFALQFPQNTALFIHNGDKLTSMQGMCFGSNLRKIVIDKIGAVNCEGIVQSSFYLQSFEVTGENKAATLDYAFSNCYSLKSALGLDCSAITLSYGLDGIFNNDAQLERFDAVGMKHSFDISMTAMKHDAILEVFKNLGTVTAGSGITLTIGDEKKALMTTEEIKIATDKGWEVA